MSTGRGAIAFERVGEATTVARAFANAPLKILTPKNHGAARWTFLSTYGGGLVDGDSIALEVRVGPGARALVGTQASTKIYRCPRGGVTQSIDAEVGEDGLLVVAPDPLVPFADARHEQRATIRLAAGASLAWVDVLSCGRAARGERWAFARHASRTRVLSEGALVAEDALVLDARDRDLARAMGRFDALATLLLFGPALAKTRDAILAKPLAAPRADVVFSASPLANGACVRVAGASVGAVSAFVRDSLAPLRAALGDDPFARKW